MTPEDLERALSKNTRALEENTAAIEKLLKEFSELRRAPITPPDDPMVELLGRGLASVLGSKKKKLRP